MHKIFRSRVVAVTTGALVVVGLGTTSGYAAAQITSAQIKDQTIQARDIQAGAVGRSEIAAGAVGNDELSDRINTQLAQRASNGTDGDSAYEIWLGQGNTGTKADFLTSLHGKDADMGVVHDLLARVANLEADAASGSDVNTNWVAGPGASIQDPNTVELDSRETPDDPDTSWNDANTSFASIRNLDLPVSAGSHIAFDYKLADGAETGWGAPRVQIRVGGVTYSSAHQINPDYGTPNADGSYTIDVVATSMNDNSARQVPEGTVTRATLAYDHQPKPGTVTFTNLVIDGQPISFQ